MSEFAVHLWVLAGQAVVDDGYDDASVEVDGHKSSYQDRYRIDMKGKWYDGGE